MKKHLISTAILVTMMPLAFSASYYLNSNETVSELLSDRLKIKPIYENGYLDKVLKHNNLTRAQAKRLPVGFEIRLPDENQTPEVSEVSPEMAQPVAVEETPAEVVEAAPEPTPEPEPEPTAEVHVNQRIGLSFFLDQQKGEGENNDTTSSITMGRPDLSYEIRGNRTQHEFWARLGASYLKLASDDKRESGDSFFLGDSALQYSYDIGSFLSLGLRGKYGQDTYLSESGEENYKINNPWIYGVGPVMKLGNHRNWQLTYLIIPEQNVRGSLKSKSNYDLKLTYETLFLERALQFGVHYGDNSTDEMKGTKAGASVEYFFDL